MLLPTLLLQLLGPELTVPEADECSRELKLGVCDENGVELGVNILSISPI